MWLYVMDMLFPELELRAKSRKKLDKQVKYAVVVHHKSGHTKIGKIMKKNQTYLFF